LLRLLGVLALAFAVGGEAKRPTSVKADLVFLTRDGCVNTPDMVVNLDDALKALGLPSDYTYLNIGTLPKTDARTGYPTPTVLYKGKDLFGMPKPTPPFPEPS
jgi:hypothetical protein